MPLPLIAASPFLLNADACNHDPPGSLDLVRGTYLVRSPFILPLSLIDVGLESLVISPVTSYTDQILAISRNRTSAGFSLDIPLIMLTASILKIFYWPGAKYDMALLIQAMIMVAVQIVLLKVALDNRPAWRGEGPFKGLDSGRPYNFWRWKAQRPYVPQRTRMERKAENYEQLLIFSD